MGGWGVTVQAYWQDCHAMAECWKCLDFLRCCNGSTWDVQTTRQAPLGRGPFGRPAGGQQRAAYTEHHPQRSPAPTLLTPLTHPPLPPTSPPPEIMALATELCFDDLDAPPERITGVEVPMPYAANLEAASLPQIDDIVQAVKRMLGKQ